MSSIDPLSAWQRFSTNGNHRPLKVAVLYNLKENAPHLAGVPEDVLDELDSPKNVNDYCEAIRALGHDVVAYEGNPDLVARLRENPVDICFNTCEGFRGLR